VTNKNGSVERRGHKRFQVQNRSYAALSPNDTIWGDIIDISMGGLAFRYRPREGQADGLSLDIFSTDGGFCLAHVPFATVADFEIPERKPPYCAAMRRRHVQFENLTHDQMSKLETFIQNYGTGRV
jgi:hypothetical protein